MASNDEHGRRFARILFKAPARIVVDATAHACEILDLSLKGALVSLPDGGAVRPGQSCRLEIALDGGDTTIYMNCDVVHVEDDHVGVYCREIDLDSITHLHRLLELNLGEPTLLDREFAALRAL